MTTPAIAKLFVKVTSTALLLLQDRAGSEPLFDQGRASWAELKVDRKNLMRLNKAALKANILNTTIEHVPLRKLAAELGFKRLNRRLTEVLRHIASLHDYETDKKKEISDFAGWKVNDLNTDRKKPILKDAQFSLSSAIARLQRLGLVTNQDAKASRVWRLTEKGQDLGKAAIEAGYLTTKCERK
jgi:hypothetical protein